MPSIGGLVAKIVNFILGGMVRFFAVGLFPGFEL